MTKYQPFFFHKQTIISFINVKQFGVGLKKKNSKSAMCQQGLIPLRAIKHSFFTAAEEHLSPCNKFLGHLKLHLFHDYLEKSTEWEQKRFTLNALNLSILQITTVT